MVIDDLKQAHPQSAIGTRWQLVTDRVMGGVSRATMACEMVGGRMAIRLRGEVSLENNGGFVQIALDLAPDRGLLDAGGYAGIEAEVFGNGEPYGAHLRTAAVTLPWQSFRHEFLAPPSWCRIRLPFAGFAPHRISEPLDVRRLRRIGIVAIGRRFAADIALSRIALYRAD